MAKKEAKRFFSLNLYETLAIGFLSFISLHVYEISVNQAVHKTEFKHLSEQVLKNTLEIDRLRNGDRYPPKDDNIPKMFLLPDRRKIHNELLKS